MSLQRFGPCVVCLIILGIGPARAEDPIKPSDIRKVVADGKHNAFTALVHWKEAYWLAFRKATDHNSADGDIVVLRSTDAETWTEVLRLNAVPDDRDPQMLATDKRLFLYDPGMTGRDLATYVVHTDDGLVWSKPEIVYEPRYILWKPLAVGDKFYAGAHLKSDGGKERECRLISSTDGLKWSTVSRIRAGNWESETTPYFPAPDRAVAFLRQKYGSPESAILESTAPFEKWSTRPAGVHLSGHSVHTINGVTYVLSRTRQGSTMGTMVYVFDTQPMSERSSLGKLIPYCEIPSGGDCSYPEAVQIGSEMLVSYYSSHEGSTNVYTCRIPLK